MRYFGYGRKMERKEIPGFPGYEIDDQGNVWSLGSKFKSGRDKLLKPGHSSNGYLIVVLSREKKQLK